MEVFDLKTMKTHSYAKREKNVFYRTSEFKARIIELPPGGEMPPCEMVSYTVFYVIAGKARISFGSETVSVKPGQCLINEPGTLAIGSRNGVRLLGLQIAMRTAVPG